MKQETVAENKSMQSRRMDWENGIWTRSPASEAVAEIVIGGDWAPIRDFSKIILENPEAIYGDLLPEIRSADFRIANLECPLVEGGTPVNKSGSVLKGDAAHVHGLATVPFDVVTLGNNHVFDYGVDAFFQTRELLMRNGIHNVGAGATAQEAEKPLMAAVNGLRIGIISFSEGEDLTAAGNGPGVFGWEVDRVSELVREIRPDVHAILVVCHGGVEYIPYPPPYLADALQRIAAAGADLVIGHHPHVPQGVQIYEGAPICYSLGNFVFFQQTDLLFRKIGYLVKAGINENGITGIRLVPYEILPDRLRRLAGSGARWFFEQLREVSKPLDNFAQIVDAWNGFLKHYGTDGFREEIRRIMTAFDREMPKGAAMFRNRLTTLQHRHHLVDLMTRIVAGTLDDAPAWAVARTAQWLTQKRTENMPPSGHAT